MLYGKNGDPRTIGPGSRIVWYKETGAIVVTDENDRPIYFDGYGEDACGCYQVSSYRAFSVIATVIANAFHCRPRLLQENKRTLIDELIGCDAVTNDRGTPRFVN
jgi:hypothetical protein